MIYLLRPKGQYDCPIYQENKKLLIDNKIEFDVWEYGRTFETAGRDYTPATFIADESVRFYIYGLLNLSELVVQ